MAAADRTRGYGDFYHYHRLAAGQLDAVIESDVNILDIAALSLIVEEAGGVFSAALFEAGLVDEVVVYIAPILCGGGVPALAGGGFRESTRLLDPQFLRLGHDIRLRARVSA